MITAKEIAKKFNLELIGDDVFIQNLGKLKFSKDRLLSFAESRKYIEEGLSKPNICALVISKDFEDIKTNKTLLRTEYPRFTFYQIHRYLVENTDFYMKKTKSKISKTADIHDRAYISDYNVCIGDNVKIGPNVSILEGSHIQNDVVIQAGTVIGSKGLESYKYKDKMYTVLHGGGVFIDKYVEIGPNCCIDKGLFRENTIIGKYTKIGDLVLIGHNVRVGKRTNLTGGVCVGGSVEIGNDVWVGFGSTIINGVKIGNNAFISISAVVTKNVANNVHVSGPAILERFLPIVGRR